MAAHFLTPILEAIVALPTNMFYNTGIPTFIWIITNNKPKHKKAKSSLSTLQMINIFLR